MSKKIILGLESNKSRPWWGLIPWLKSHPIQVRTLTGILALVGRRGSGKSSFASDQMVQFIEDKTVRYVYSRGKLDWRLFYDQKRYIFQRVPGYFQERANRLREADIANAEAKFVHVKSFEHFLEIIRDLEACVNSVFFLDEIHHWIGADSSRRVDPDSLAIAEFISMLRRIGAFVISVAQFFGDVNKQVRLQCDVIGVCKLIRIPFIFTATKVDFYWADEYKIDEVNGSIIGQKRGTKWCFHYPGLYAMYNTFEILSKTGEDKKASKK